MNRMKQILEGNDIELLLNEVISNVFHKGLIDISDSETLSLHLYSTYKVKSSFI